ncbi:MAG: hypothetical protein FJW37_03955 [Acidobacteria bacterium]|nr:hypothetical protein [Acidobacteriota bacterium]
MLLFGLTVLLSAFLLFEIQPVIARAILPWFGGSAAVWTTCLLFFQVLLLAGYAYAYAIFRYLRPGAQSAVHVALLLASLAALPVIPAAAWKPAGTEDPVFRILGLLAATVGLPYFLLAATAPLVQPWYAFGSAKAVSPYRLYALSNAGSMFALLSYPVMFEPVLTSRQQALGWSSGYALFALLCGASALRARSIRSPGAEAAVAGPRPGWGDRLLWVALAASASLLLLAVTNHLTQNVAAIPFLWVLPLSIYLLSFILCFEGGGWYRRGPMLRFLAVALGTMAYALSEGFENTTLKVLIPLYSVGLFAASMACHGELARLKPHPRYLTSFYLLIAVGGALGGVFVGLVAPRAFGWYFELPVGIVACAVLVLIVLRRQGAVSRSVWWVAAGLTVAMAFFLGAEMRRMAGQARVIARNFYGGLRVVDSEEREGRARKLMHGTVNHGQQWLDPARRQMPTTYFGPDSGIGLAIRAASERPNLRVGVIGLGTGTLAAYGRPGDHYRFYELNPLVLEIARSQFTFLEDSKASVEVALGDGRLSLEREAPQNFDLLALDAFSSDAIPVHLLTREAFELYFRHLKPGGVLAAHVSNKYLDLAPVVEVLAKAAGAGAVVIDTRGDEQKASFAATWVLVSRRPEFLRHARTAPGAATAASPRKLRLWTDDYSNLLRILR